MECPVMISISAPSASQERIIVPRLPLFDGLSNNTIKGFSESDTFSSLSSRISMIAINSDVSSLLLRSFISSAVRQKFSSVLIFAIISFAQPDKLFPS